MVSFLVFVAVPVGLVLCLWYYTERNTGKLRLNHLNSHLAIHCTLQKDVTAWELAYIMECNLIHAYQCSFDVWDNIPNNVKRHLVVERDPRKEPYTAEEAKI